MRRFVGANDLVSRDFGEIRHLVVLVGLEVQRQARTIRQRRTNLLDM